jgi:hypothetical protein
MIMAADLAIKEPCRVATTANITLSGLQTVDGVTVANGDRVLVRAQTTASQNGIYVAASGAWARATDFDGGGEVAGGTEVFVTSGTLFAVSTWRVTGSGPITIGTSNIVFRAETRERVSILDFRTTADDNDSLAAAFAAGKRRIYFPPGQGLGTNGEYEIQADFGTEGSPNPGNIPASGVWLSGGGIGRTVFRRQTRPVFLINKTGDPLEDIHFSDMTFIDDVVGEGFDETPDLILLMLAGVSRFSLRRCAFVGFRNDGLNIGIGPHNFQEKHNYEGTIEECLFDGVNQNNRAAITVLDCDGLTIRNNLFINCTRNDMPGVVNVEPNSDPPLESHDWYVNRNVKIQGNRFIDHGGSAIALFLRSQDSLQTPQQHFVVEGNYARNGGRGMTLIGYAADLAATATDGYDLIYRNNIVKGSEAPFFVDGLLGGAIVGNQFYDCGDGQLSGGSLCKDVLVTQNRFVRCGQNQGPVMAVDGGLEDVTVEDNLFVDCGRPDGIQGWAVFLRDGDLRRFRFRHNIAEHRDGAPDGSPVGEPTLTNFIAVSGGHLSVIEYDTCEERDNQAVNYPVSDPQLPYYLFPAYGPVPSEEPGAVGFANSWQEFPSSPTSPNPSPLRISRNREGRVFIEGGVTGGTVTTGTLMFTLAVGFRPAIEIYVPVYTNGALGMCKIIPAGGVYTAGGISNVSVMFDASFSA